MNVFENPNNPDGSALLMAVRVVKRFLPAGQYMQLTQACASAQDMAYSIQTFHKLNATIQALPTTYHQAHKGNDAIAYLHYGLGRSHWWITEKDRMGGVHRAGGLTLLDGDAGEGTTGYISIAEIIEQGAMLDVQFVPKTLASIKQHLAPLRRDEGSLWPKPGEALGTVGAVDSLFTRIVKHMAFDPRSPYCGADALRPVTVVHHG